MNIIFKNIKLNNFMSFLDAEIKLNNNGYVIVSGINNTSEDGAKSNGSGKSSIWEGIVWCLTGDTIRGTKQVTNIYSNGVAKVDLSFSIEDNNYRIIRTKDDKKSITTLKLYVNDEDKSGKGVRDTEKIMQNILPDLTPQLIGSVIVLGQGLPQRFTNNSPSGRKEVLEQLSKSDFLIEDIKNKLVNRKNTLNNELREIEDTLLKNISQKEIYENKLNKLKIEKDNLKPIDFDSLIIENQNNQNNLSNQLKELEEEKNNLTNQINSQLDLYSDKNQFFIKERNLFISNYKEENNINELVKQIEDLRVERTSTLNQIRMLEAISDICPTCHQKLPDVHKVDTSNLHRNVDNLDIQIKEKESVLGELNNNIEIKLNEFESKFNEELNNIKEQGKKLREQLNGVENKIKSLNLNLNDLKTKLNTLNSDKNNYNLKSNTIDRDIQDTIEQIDKFSENILYNNTNKDNKLAHIEMVQRMSTIATKDFRGYLLSEIIQFIDKKAKEYSSNRINFKLEGGNIDIYFCDKQYENLSGGEKQKVDLIIQFTIRDMLTQFLNFSSNILVLDEIFDNLDSLGCQEVLDLISDKLTTVESIYIITHHTDIQIPYDDEITIIKENNISYIKG